jgi:signal transduction histidine kinase/tetratricopeptide (TPR) repeat protein
VPYIQRGIDYSNRAITIAQRLGNPWGKGQALTYNGVALYAATRYKEAQAQCEEAVRILEQSGDVWQANVARWHVAMCQYRLGSLQEARATIQRVYSGAMAVGDHQAAAIALGIWAKASAGDVPEKELMAALARHQEDIHAQAEVRTGYAIWLLRAGRPGDAVRTLREADDLVQRKGLQQEYVAPVLPWLATALRHELMGASMWAARERRANVKEATKVIRRALRLAGSYRNNLPHAHREAGYLAACEGRSRAAYSHLSTSLQIAQEQGASYEAALTRVAQAEIGAALGLAEAGATLSSARNQVRLLEGARQEPKRSTLALVDRFAGVVEFGRRIAAALSRDAVLEEARRATIAMLRGEETSLIERSEKPFVELLAAEARRTRAPVVFPGIPGLEDDAARARVKSAICIPILVRGEVDTCLYAKHSGVADLFGADDQRLAQFIATIAGTALENAQGLADLKKAQNEMSVQKSMLESQAEASVEGILLVGLDGKILSYNRNFANMWKIPEETLHSGSDEAALDSVLKMLVKPEEFLQRVRHLYDHPTETSREEIQLTDGRIFDRHSAPVQSSDGAIQGRVWFFRDITQEKAAEDNLRATNERLRQLDQMKTQFINMAAHELNTPLTPLLIQMKVLKDSTSGRDRKAVAVMERNLTRLARLVRDLLDASRLQAEKLRINLDKTDCCALVKQILETFSPLAKSSNVKLVDQLEPGLEARIDAQRISQIIYNLVANALKFTPAGGTVTVTLRRDEANAVLSVHDTGIGMSPELMAKLFQPFTQARSAAGGTGLGLYISRGIAQAHGGTLWCESEGPGHGSTFTCVLPINGPTDA